MCPVHHVWYCRLNGGGSGLVEGHRKGNTEYKGGLLAAAAEGCNTLISSEGTCRQFLCDVLERRVDV